MASEAEALEDVELASDIVMGASGLSGIIIVYVGVVGTTYSTCNRQKQSAVHVKLCRPVTIAGIVIVVISVGFALVWKWDSSRHLVS